MPVTKLSPKKLGKPILKKKPSPTNKSTESEEHNGFCGMRPFRAILYGPSGVGKSSFGASFEDVGFIIDPQELGILELVAAKQCKKPNFIEKVGTWESLLDTCERVAGDQSCKTLVLDSLTGLEKLCFIAHCREYFEDDWTKKGFFNYSQGPKNAAKIDWPKFIDALNVLAEADINVLVIAHSKVKNFENPEGPNYDRYIPYLDPEIWQVTHRWASIVLFYNYYVLLEKSGQKHKAKDTDQRNLYTTRTPAWDAKNQYGLDPVILAGDSGEEAYEAFKTEMEKVAAR